MVLVSYVVYPVYLFAIYKGLGHGKYSAAATHI